MQPNMSHSALDTVVSACSTRMSEIISDNRARLAAAPQNEAWRVALLIVEVEEWPQVAAAMVTSALPCSTCIAAHMLVSMVQHLSELQQCILSQYNSADALRQDTRRAALSTIPEQLQQPLGLLATLQEVFTDVQEQRQRQGDQQSTSSCRLGHGSDCAAALAAATPTPAHVAQGSGPPCRSCMLAHAELLVACSALLRFWPDCVVQHAEPVAWSWVAQAAECAVAMLQDVSTAVLQHHEQQRQPHAAAIADDPQPTAPPADVLQPGSAALQMLAAVCSAAANLSFGALVDLAGRQQLCERGMLDHPCMLPSMLAVGAAAVLGQEMQRRLCRTTAVATTAHAGSATGSAGAAAVACSSTETEATTNAAASQDGGMRSSGRDSGSDSSSQGTKQGSVPNTLEAAWQLVCVTEQWAGGQLLPQPFALLVEALGCNPKAFLLLACIWQQQQEAGNCCQAAGSDRHAVAGVLAELSKAYGNVFSYYPPCEQYPRASPSLLQRMSICDEKGQQKPQQAQQHLQMALLLMREAVRGAHRGMFRFEPRPSDPVSELGRGSFAVKCVSTWLCWAQFRQQQRQQLGDAAAAGAATQQQDPWGVGGEASSAVLVELLRGHFLLLREGARELQAVSSSWVAVDSSSDSIDSNDIATGPDGQVYFGGALYPTNRCVADILQKVRGLLRCLIAVAAVDSKVLQQAAGHLFGLAGTLEQLVRVRTSFLCRKLVMSVDEYVPQLLHLLLGSINLSAYVDNPKPWEVGIGNKMQPSAAAVARAGIRACGLLPFLATRMNADGRQQRQLLGLLFSAMKLFSAYPTGLCRIGWSQEPHEVWLGACVDTIWAACTVSRRLLLSGTRHGMDAVYLTGTHTCGQAVGGSCSSTAQSAHQQQQHKQAGAAPGAASNSTGGCGSSAAGAGGCHTSGLGTEGTAALLPWLVLQGRALQLWVALFRAHVQLLPQGSASSSKVGVSRDQAPRQVGLVGSAAALKVLAGAFQGTVLPSTQLLAAFLQGTASQVRAAAHELAYGVPERSQDPIIAHMKVEKCNQQLLAYCQQQGLDLTLLGAAAGSAAMAAAAVKSVLVATGDSLQELGNSADAQHKLRQSDVRRYLKTWQVADPAVLKGVLAMLSSGQHSAAGVAVAAWLCSRSIAGDLLDSLQDLSTQLSTLPIHEACNNPACRVTVGSREQALVSGKACVCGGCRMGHYCSRSCQREHWPVHQLQCGAARTGVGKQ